MGRSTIFDWEEIRRFYQAGHTLQQCRARFGFSNGAWHAAVARGDVVPRADRRPRAEGRTRRAVRELLEQGVSQAEAARRLSLSAATVAHHARALGVPPRSACAVRYDWAEVQRYHEAGHSKRACQAHFGFSAKTWYDAVVRGALKPRPAAAPIEVYLVRGRRVNRQHLKMRLLAAGLKQPRCEHCGIDKWLGRPLSMALHHINGEGDDNRLENLQLLCPNCHSQTPNFAGRGRKPRRRGLSVVADVAADAA